MSEPSIERVEELFHKALALPVRERAAFLERACAGDRVLSRAVEDMLRSDARAEAEERFLVSPLLRPFGAPDGSGRAGETVAGGAEPARASGAGGAGLPAVPGYQVLRELGRGGMGVVYQARELGLYRMVALKMLPAKPATERQMKRFELEAQSLARLNHPNIVDVYGVGSFEGRPFFAMEYVAGPSLAQLLGDRAQDARASARLIATVARALDAIHRAGLVHRDIKPANILLEDPPAAARPVEEPWPLDAYRPKLTDFGLAQDTSEPVRLTQTGMAMGTPSYMAPEQARGRKPVGPRADIFALGAVLYEMLTGRPPFEGPSAAETLSRLLHREAESPARSRPDLPHDLVTICLKCLEKSPRDRYPTAAALADDLERFLTGRPVQARRVGLAERGYRWVRRNRLTAAALAAAVLLGLTLAGTLLVGHLRTEWDRRQRAELTARLAQRDLDGGDDFLALLRLVEVLRLEQGRAGEAVQRVRIGTLLRETPRLEAVRQGDGPVLAAQLDGGGPRRTVGLDKDRGLVIRDLPADGAGAGAGAAAGAGRAVGTPIPVEGEVVGAIFSPDGRLLAVRTAGGPADLWLVEVGSGRRWPAALPGPVDRLAFTRAGDILLAWLKDGRVSPIETRHGGPAGLAGREGGPARAGELAADGRTAFLVETSGRGRLWDLALRQPLGPSWAVPDGWGLAAVRPAQLAPARQGVLLSRERDLVLVDGSDGRVIRGPVGHADPVVLAAFSPDGSRLFLGSRAGPALLWHLADGRIEAVQLSMRHRAEAAWFSPDGSLLAVYTSAEGVRVWDTATGQPVTPGLRQAVATVAAALSAGRELEVAAKDGLYTRWRLPPADGHVVAEAWPGTDRTVALPGEKPWTYELGDATTVQVTDARTAGALDEEVLHSPDGRRLAVVDVGGVRVWDTRRLDRVPQVMLCAARPVLGAFGPDGGRLAVATEAPALRVWDVERSEPLTPVLRHPCAIVDVDFADRERVLTRGHDGKVRAWDLRPDERPVAELQQLAQVLAARRLGPGGAGRRLTAEEMRAVLEGWQPERPGPEGR